MINLPFPPSLFQFVLSEHRFKLRCQRLNLAPFKKYKIHNLSVPLPEFSCTLLRKCKENFWKGNGGGEDGP